MFYFLFGDLEHPLRLGPWTLSFFHYITFRAALAGMSAFLAAIVLGPRVIRVLADRRIREATDKTDSARVAQLHSGKRATPTMGGLILVGGFLASVLLFADCANVFVLVGIGLVVALAGIGFLDDWIKLTDPVRKGLRARTKFAALVVAGAAAGFLVARYADGSAGRGGAPSVLAIPFAKHLVLDIGWGWYVALVALVVTASSNAVNLTDGLDGLATGCSVIAALALAALAYAIGHAGLSAYLYLPHRPGAGEATVLCVALAGSALGFLWYNAPPAQIFMGDTGSLPLGGEGG